MTRKKKWLIAAGAAVLAIILTAVILLSMSAKYDRSLENWELGQYLEAAKGFYGLKGYKESGVYLAAFEEKLIASLMGSPWRSEEAEYEQGEYRATGTWQFLFREDYTGTENHISKDSASGESVKSYGFTYKFQCYAGRMMLILTYEAGEEAPYLLTVTEQDGTLTVEKLYGAFQFYETYTMADYLPEE